MQSACRHTRRVSRDQLHRHCRTGKASHAVNSESRLSLRVRGRLNQGRTQQMPKANPQNSRRCRLSRALHKARFL